MTAPYKPREAGTVKRAMADLVEACGGQKVVAGLLGCSQQHVARMTDEDFPKAEMRMAQIVLLERHCGHRIVTEWMAAEQGCTVEPLQVRCHDSLPIVVGRITNETGELLSAAAMDMQAGKLTATNARRVLGETDDVICAVLALRADARAVLSRGRS